MGTQLAINTTTNTLYTLNSSAKTVTVVSIATGTITATISLATTPSYIAVNTATNVIYVTTGSINTCIVINGNTNTITTTVSLAGSGGQMAINTVTNYVYIIGPTNSVYVLNGANNSVATTSVYSSATIYYGSGSGITVDTTANKVYILYTSTGGTATYLCVLAGTTYSTYATISTTSTASLDQSVSLLPGSNYAIVSYAEATGSLVTIKVVNTSTYAVSAAQTGPGLGTATTMYGSWLNPTTGNIYICTNLSILIVNGTTAAILGTIPLTNVQYATINTTTNTMYAWTASTIKSIDLGALNIASISNSPSSFNGFAVNSANILCVLAGNIVTLLTYATLTTYFPSVNTLSVVSGGNRLQSGSANTNTSYIATVTFPVPFNSVPVVDADSVGSNSWVDVTAVSTTSFSVYSYNATGTALANVSFGWTAVGT